MATMTPSSKYQVVIPKKLRESMDIKPGQTLYIQAISDSEARISTQPAVDRAFQIFGGSKIWGDDPMQWLKEERKDRKLI